MKDKVLSLIKEVNEAPAWLQSHGDTHYIVTWDARVIAIDAQGVRYCDEEAAKEAGVTIVPPEQRPPAIVHDLNDDPTPLHAVYLERMPARSVYEFGRPIGAYYVGTTLHLKYEALRKVVDWLAEEGYELRDVKPYIVDGERWWTFNAYDHPYVWDAFEAVVMLPEHKNAISAEADTYTFEDLEVVGRTYWDGHNFRTVVLSGEGFDPDIEEATAEETALALLADEAHAAGTKVHTMSPYCTTYAVKGVRIAYPRYATWAAWTVWPEMDNQNVL